MKRPACTLLILAAASLTACDSGAGEKPERNVIKEYVNEPKDKAYRAKNAVEDAQERVRRQSQNLLDEGED